MTTDAIARFDADAAARGLRVEVVERPAADSLAGAADLLGITPGDVVKTLVVKRHDGDFVLALVPGGRSIAWKKLRAVVGVNKLSMPDAATALQATGYERGTITPIGATGDLPVFADERIVGRRVALGAGRHGASAFVDADDLIAAYGATVADITDEEPQR
ncbi:aminoacyl-tRNA deacylase [Curtobacterium sp. 9128]|uniref:aminoacyl-tRNA deacylase n=1 Tax=Curtobacterium sp. 9128 TaxID=1793722 RepID=UPI0011A62D3C|nr:YbaK/EbsC family protein [Curtobacterium sp. 9128]